MEINFKEEKALLDIYCSLKEHLDAISVYCKEHEKDSISIFIFSSGTYDVNMADGTVISRSVTGKVTLKKTISGDME